LEVACFAGEAEARPVASGRADAERVRHAHVAAGTRAVQRRWRHVGRRRCIELQR
jgi:hypothetical protein